MLGLIKDLDEVYFNGDMIGHTGVFPKDQTAAVVKEWHTKERAYFIPPYLIKSDNNVIAVRVMDTGNQGGISAGYIGITTRENYLKYSKRKKR